MKGASISYGTNYLFRMAVRKTGMVTYGVGFNNDNGEYFWNDERIWAAALPSASGYSTPAALIVQPAATATRIPKGKPVTPMHPDFDSETPQLKASPCTPALHSTVIC